MQHEHERQQCDEPLPHKIKANPLRRCWQSSFGLPHPDHQVTPHLACKATTIIDDRTIRHPGYLISQQKRKRIEEIFGWLKTVAGLRKTRHRGTARVGWMFRFALAAYNLVRMHNLLPAAA